MTTTWSSCIRLRFRWFLENNHKPMVLGNFVLQKNKRESRNEWNWMWRLNEHCKTSFEGLSYFPTKDSTRARLFSLDILFPLCDLHEIEGTDAADEFPWLMELSWYDALDEPMETAMIWERQSFSPATRKELSCEHKDKILFFHEIYSFLFINRLNNEEIATEGISSSLHL